MFHGRMNPSTEDRDFEASDKVCPGRCSDTRAASVQPAIAGACPVCPTIDFSGCNGATDASYCSACCSHVGYSYRLDLGMCACADNSYVDCADPVLKNSKANLTWPSSHCGSLYGEASTLLYTDDDALAAGGTVRSQSEPKVFQELHGARWHVTRGTYKGFHCGAHYYAGYENETQSFTFADGTTLTITK